MSEDLPVNRMSFRADKQTELLNLKKNQFGHTVASESSDESTTDNVKLRFGGSGTGIVAHVDLFDSPHLKKFIQDSDLDDMDTPEDQDVEEIDLSEEEIKLFPGNPKRDFIYVKDVVKLMALIGNHDGSGEVFNAGSGESTSINDLYKIINKQIFENHNY